MDTIEERVARGAALLDQQRPGWVNEIHLRSLNIGSTERCVLGQLSGITGSRAYTHGLSDLGLISTAEAVHYGFSEGLGRTSHEYARLTEVWRNLIARRREHAASHEFTLPT